MPSLDQIFPYVLRWGQRATDSGACAASSIILVVRLTARISNRSLTLPRSCREYSTFSWTVVRWRRTTAQEIDFALPPISGEYQ